jgi:hypothetical protein
VFIRKRHNKVLEKLKISFHLLKRAPRGGPVGH